MHARRRRTDDDLRVGRFAAAARPALQRAAVFGDLPSGPDRILPDFRADFPRPAAGALGACDPGGLHEAGGPPAPGGGGGDPPARAAGGVSAVGSFIAFSSEVTSRFA